MMTADEAKRLVLGDEGRVNLCWEGDRAERAALDAEEWVGGGQVTPATPAELGAVRGRVALVGN